MASLNNIYEKARTKALGGFPFKNKYTELLSLDKILNKNSIHAEVNLGYMEIMTENIIGTRSSSRAYGFSRNFMPVLEEKSEFSTKWLILYESVLENGILEPIKVYEYMHKYYVEEGNKRVSVSKYIGAPLLPATVTRIIPKYDENNEEIVVYYEFLEFYKKLPVSFLNFSKRGDYKKFYKKIIDLKKDIKDTEELVKEIRFIFNEFKTIYEKLGGKKLSISTSDALLQYLSLYDDFGLNLEKNLRCMWSELYAEDDTLELEKDSPENVGIIESIANFSSKKNQIRVAFAHYLDPIKSQWTSTHYKAIKEVENSLGNKVKIDNYFNIPTGNTCYESLEDIAKNEYDVIFTTSTAFMNDTVKVSLNHRNVRFLNASEKPSSKSVRTYYNRTFELSFILGILAGSMTFTDSVGILVSHPIPEDVRSVNAFVLGGRLINKDFNAYVKWMPDFTPKEEDIIDIDEQFSDFNCDIVWHNIACESRIDEKLGGLFILSDKNDTKSRLKIAYSTWDWTKHYEKILTSILDGSYAYVANSLGFNNKAISYFWGLNMGAGKLEISERLVPESVLKTADLFIELIKSNKIDIFAGPIRDREGKLIVEKNDILSSEKIRNMDFFIEGVKGSIPSIDLMDDSEKLLEVLGVKKKY